MQAQTTSADAVDVANVGRCFVDTHVHFNDKRHPTLVWRWLEPGVVHPVLGDIDQIKHFRYDAVGLRAESRFSGTTKVVHVQAALGSPDPVDETEWLHAMFSRTGWPNAIIAYTDLKSKKVEEELERHHSASPNLRGIRDFSEGDYLRSAEFHRGYALLGKFALVCDLDCKYENMESACKLAQRYPDVSLILEHTGFPPLRTPTYFAAWKKGLALLAQADNAFCKISGLGMMDRTWTLNSLRPWILSAIEIFGVERCFFGTNWPVDRLYSSYSDLISAYRSIIGDFSVGEQQALFSHNAERVYRI